MPSVDEPAVIAVVGAGPRGVGFLERLSANAVALSPGRRIDVHLIDPFPPGPGRVWRHEQSPLLRMNSMAEDVTMFTDDSVRCEGPIVPGPSMAEWASLARASLGASADADLRDLTSRTFPTRQMASRYLSWFFDQVTASLPDTLRVHVRADVVERITGPADGRQQVWLAGAAAPLAADAVVVAIGHLDTETQGPARDLADFADRRGLYYLPPAYTADVDLDDIPAGEPLLVRGLGLAFIDLMALLTEGRGGTYRAAPGGSLTYVPSGREPLLYAGSRRGVPYHAKIGYGLSGPRPPLPRFFGPDTVKSLINSHDRLDFRSHVWPLVAKEIGWGYYAKLDRLAMPWPDFAAAYATLDWYSAEMRALIAAAVPDPADRLDIEELDHPLRDRWFADPDELQRHVREYVTADIARRSDPGHGADLGAFLALLSCYAQLPEIVASGRLDADSRRAGLEGWWVGFFSFYASGPPADRLEQLLALSRAGLVRFLGADMWVRADEQRGVFVAGSASTDELVTARALAEARLPKATVTHTANTLLRALRDGRAGVEEILADGKGSGLILTSSVDGRLIDGTDLATGEGAAGGDAAGDNATDDDVAGVAGDGATGHGAASAAGDGAIGDGAASAASDDATGHGAASAAGDGVASGVRLVGHRRRFALGPFTTVRTAAAFARPNTNAPAFRYNDATARAVLRLLAELAAPPTPGRYGVTCR